MHLNPGEIRAYHDQELDLSRRQQIQEHLESCTRCQEHADELFARAQRVNAHITGLQPGEAGLPAPARAGRLRLAERLPTNEKENITMWNKMTSRISRPVWVALAVILVLAVALAFAPVRAIANSFLGLFRVEQIRVVQFNPEDLPDEPGSASQLEQMLSKNAVFEENGEPQDVASADEASQLTGITVRLPSQAEGESKITVTPGGSATFNVDLELVGAVLKDIGREDIQLPKELDNASVTVEIPAGVVAQYGECSFDKEAVTPDPDNPPHEFPRLNCTTLMQMPSPTISAPPGLNLAQVGEAYLQLLGMSREEAESFARNVDWTTTFVIPVPRYGTEYQDVSVDGVTGTLIQQYRDEFLLLWVKDGVIYALSGPGDADTALALANSLK